MPPDLGKGYRVDHLRTDNLLASHISANVTIPYDFHISFLCTKHSHYCVIICASSMGIVNGMHLGGVHENEILYYYNLQVLSG